MKRIAVIDDENDILVMFERFLKRNEKLEIDTFLNPKNFLATMKSRHYDLILLDIMMPEVNGLDILEEIKKTTPFSKVIMMTAYSTIDKVLASNEFGAEDYLTKPFVSLRDVESKVLENLGL